MSTEKSIATESRNLRLLGLAVLIGVVGYVFYLGLGGALLPLTGAFLAAYLVYPLVHWLENKGIRRQWAVLTLLTAITLLSLLTIVLALPGLIADIKDAIAHAPSQLEAAIVQAEGLLVQFGFEVHLDKEFFLSQLKDRLQHLSGNAFSSVTKFVGSTFQSLISGVTSLLNVFLFPLFFYYILMDYEEYLAAGENLIPAMYRSWVREQLTKIDTILSGYIRGQLMVASAVGVLNAVLLSIVGLKFGFLIGLMSGALNIIPYVGFAIGFGTAMVVVAANFSWPLLIGTCAVFFGVQALEGTIITPKIVGDKVGLGPLATMLALILGGNLGGFLGMLIAIPAFAIFVMLFQQARDRLRLSTLLYSSNK